MRLDDEMISEGELGVIKWKYETTNKQFFVVG